MKGLQRINVPKALCTAHELRMVKKTRRIMYYVPTRRGKETTATSPQPDSFDADPITIYNWDGGKYYRLKRGSKKRVWACQLRFREGFTFMSNGKKIFGRYSNWLVLDGKEKYVMTRKMFDKTFWEEDGQIF